MHIIEENWYRSAYRAVEDIELPAVCSAQYE